MADVWEVLCVMPLAETHLPDRARHSMLLDGTHQELFPIVNAIGTGVAVFAADQGEQFVLVTANDQYSELADAGVEEFVGRRVGEIFPRYLAKELAECLRSAVLAQQTSEMEAVIDRRGAQRWWRFIFAPLMVPGRSVSRVMHTSIEITDKKQLEFSLAISRKRFEAVVEAAYDGILTVGRDYRINMVNDAACDIFGLSRRQLIDASLDTVIPQSYRGKHMGYFQAFGESPVMNRPMEARADVRGLRSDGTEFPAEVSIAKLKVGEDNEFMAVVRDISERAKLIEELKRAATEDSLTGVYNRRFFEEVLLQEVRRARRYCHPLGLIMLDVDGFKSINDTHGHGVGDQVLVALTEIILGHLREADRLARWGGDEFMIVVPETEPRECAVLVARIQAAIASAPAWRRLGVEVAVSFGLAAMEASDEGGEALLKRVDDALYAAKRRSRTLPE
jgi:diguanylate cyclase (GGDEF)-like protein/PAS domain S-box-containing protein